MKSKYVANVMEHIEQFFHLVYVANNESIIDRLGKLEANILSPLKCRVKNIYSDAF